MNDYYVAMSRDCTSGARLIEVGLLDDLSPQMCEMLGAEPDPRDAVEIAIAEAKSRGLPIARGIGSLGFYVSEGDTMTPDEARDWAVYVIAERGLCEKCGTLLTEESVCDEYDEDARFCGVSCWQMWTYLREEDYEAELANA